jgi:hypothetical protein
MSRANFPQKRGAIPLHGDFRIVMREAEVKIALSVYL